MPWEIQARNRADTASREENISCHQEKKINKCLFLSDLKCFYFNGTCFKCWHKSQRRGWLLLPSLVKEEDSLSISTSAHLTLIPMSWYKTSEMFWLYRKRKNSLKINSDGAFGILRLWPMLRPSLCLKDIHMYNCSGLLPFPESGSYICPCY